MADRRLPIQLQALALAIAFAVFTGEAMAEQMVVELSDQASDLMQSPARARLGESGPETGTGGAGEEDKAKVRMQAAVKKALNDNSVDAVKELLLTNQAEANKKAARSELPTTTEGAEEVVKQMEDPVNAQNDNKPRKKTKEDIVKEKLAALLDKFERATSPDQAQIMKRKIAFYHRQ